MLVKILNYTGFQNKRALPVTAISFRIIPATSSCKMINQIDDYFQMPEVVGIRLMVIYAIIHWAMEKPGEVRLLR